MQTILKDVRFKQLLYFNLFKQLNIVCSLLKTLLQLYHIAFPPISLVTLSNSVNFISRFFDIFLKHFYMAGRHVPLVSINLESAEKILLLNATPHFYFCYNFCILFPTAFN